MRETMPQTIGIPKETFAGEKRVATAPEVVEKLIKLGFAVTVESGAGNGASFYDDAYAAAGAKILIASPTLVRNKRRALAGAFTSAGHSFFAT